MNEKIIDFFKFLEEKKWTKTPLKFKLLNHDKFKFTKKDLNVRGYLDLTNTNITSLPDNLKVGGDLYLSHSKITSLPNNFKIKGSLMLRATQITSLPDNLKVDGYLDLRDIAIKSLPNDLSVGEIIFVDKDKLEYFRNKYPQFNFKL